MKALPISNGNKRKKNDRMVDQFHAGLSKSHKEAALSSFMRPKSTVRCTIETTALALCMDIPDVKYIVNYDCPDSKIQFWQEAGRGAGTITWQSTTFTIFPSMAQDDAMYEGFRSENEKHRQALMKF